MKYSFLLSILMAAFCLNSNAQNRDKAVFKSYEPGYYQNSILKDIRNQEAKKQKLAPKYFRMDFSGMDFPTDTADYSILPHLNPHSQGATGTCWCFSTVSMLESEILRKTGKSIRLSPMFIVYHEYITRARDFVATRGETYFSEGSEATSVLRMMKRHGLMTMEAYPGKADPKAMHHNHGQMFQEMDDYLKSVKQNNAWDEEVVAQTIASILNYHMGTPPQNFSFDGKEYNPLSFRDDVCQLKSGDYFNFMSTLSQNFNEKGELVEADNWWHCDDYYNLSMDDFLGALKSSLEKGFSVTVCGDVSEAGYDKNAEVAIVPDFDIPQAYISNESRQFRLSNGTTTDDHCMHAVGYHEEGGHFWILLKDSGAGGFDGNNKGYRFMRDDYIKLKMMNFMMYRDGVRKYLDGMIK